MVAYEYSREITETPRGSVAAGEYLAPTWYSPPRVLLSSLTAQSVRGTKGGGVWGRATAAGKGVTRKQRRGSSTGDMKGTKTRTLCKGGGERGEGGGAAVFYPRVVPRRG